jgi:hypothetical protein
VYPSFTPRPFMNYILVIVNLSRLSCDEMRRNLQAVSFRVLHCSMSNWADPIEDLLIGASLTRAFSVRLEQGSRDLQLLSPQ